MNEWSDLHVEITFYRQTGDETFRSCFSLPLFDDFAGDDFGRSLLRSCRSILVTADNVPPSVADSPPVLPRRHVVVVVRLRLICLAVGVTCKPVHLLVDSEHKQR